MTITNDKNWMIWKNSYRKTALWPSCFSAFFSALILFPTFWAFGRVTMNIQGKKKKASERDRTDAKKRPWNRFAWYQGEERPVDGVTRFLKEFDRLNNLKTVWHGRTLEQAWGLGICCPYPYVTLFKYTLVYWHLWKDYNKMLGISGEYHKEKKNETSMSYSF